MDQQERLHRIARAQEVLRDIHHVAVATVNGDGSPHCSPVFMAFADDLCGYWVSHPGSTHSQNIARDGKVFLAVFDSREGHSGLFLSGTARELGRQSDAQEGLRYLQQLKARFYGSMGDISEYTGTNTQRIYRFTPELAWVNHSEKRGDAIIRDWRYEIPLNELRQS
jgi:general stress protein 26